MILYIYTVFRYLLSSMHPRQRPKLDLIELHHRLSQIPGMQTATLNSWLEDGQMHFEFCVLFYTPQMNEPEHFRFIIVRHMRQMAGRPSQQIVTEVLGQFMGMVMNSMSC
mgnify:FL=1